MATYSVVTDLLTGNIPTPQSLSPAKFVQDAADEIDGEIGHIYETPIDVSEGGPVDRPARLLLKRISNHLASGRLMMAAAAGSQKLEVHAYANKLVEEAKASLAMIASGEVPLKGAVRRDTSEESFTGPQIFNKDPESNVDAFYDRVVNPGYTFFPSGLPLSDRLVR